MWHCIDAGFSGIFCECNRALVLLVEEIYQPYHDFFSFFDISDTWFFYEVLDFLGTSFYIIL